MSKAIKRTLGPAAFEAYMNFADSLKTPENSDAIDRFISVEAEHVPDPEAVKAYRPVKEMFELCYQSMLPVYERIASR